MRRGPLLLSILAAWALLPAVFAFADGGSTPTTRPLFAAAALVALALALLAAPRGIRAGSGAKLALSAGATFAAFTALSSSWSGSSAGATAQTELAVGYLAMTLAGLLLLRGDGARDRIRLVESLIVAGVAAAVAYGLAGKAGIISLPEAARAGGRLTEPLTYWNAVGVFAAIGLVIAARIVVDRGRGNAGRMLGAAAIPLLGVAVGLTYSRAAIAASAAGLLLVVGLATDFVPRARRAAMFTAAVVIATPFVVGVFSGGDAGRESFGATAERLTQAGSNRSEYWQVAIEGFAERPVAGHGAGSFAGLWLAKREISETVRNAHSLPLETAAELGLIGLLLLGLGGAGLALAATRTRDRQQIAAAAGGLGAWLTTALVDWQWQVPAVTGLAAILAATLLASERSPSRDE